MENLEIAKIFKIELVLNENSFTPTSYNYVIFSEAPFRAGSLLSETQFQDMDSAIEAVENRLEWRNIYQGRTMTNDDG